MRELLTEFNQKFNPAHASAIISNDGLVIVSALPEHVDEDLVAGMSAALFAVGVRGSQTLAGGHMEQMVIKSPEGFLLIQPINQDVMLSVISQTETGIDLLPDEMKHAVEKIKDMF